MSLIASRLLRGAAFCGRRAAWSFLSAAALAAPLGICADLSADETPGKEPATLRAPQAHMERLPEASQSSPAPAGGLEIYDSQVQPASFDVPTPSQARSQQAGPAVTHAERKHRMFELLGLADPKRIKTPEERGVAIQTPEAAAPAEMNHQYAMPIPVDYREMVQQVNYQDHAANYPASVRMASYNEQAAAALQDTPFEVIEESGEIDVKVRRSKLLRTKVDIYRTAVVDSSVCDVVQFTPREVSIIGKGAGATHVTFWFEDGNFRPITYLVRVTPDSEERARIEVEYELLEEVLAELFPDSKVKLLLIADKLIVKGQAKSAEDAAHIMSIIRGQTNTNIANNRNFLSPIQGFATNVYSEDETGRSSHPRLQVVNMLQVPGIQQVALRVKIAQLNRSAARGIGIDAEARINFGGGDGDDQDALFIQSMLNMAAGNAPSVITQFDNANINLGLRYLQQQGVVRLLSEPTLVTLSGRPATFVSGGEFAVPTIVGGAGVNAVTTDFRAFGVIVSFLPTVLDKDRIRLQVAPEFSQINQGLNSAGTFGLNTNAVTTTVEMREGQTLAIAGLLEDTMKNSRAGNVPYLERIFGTRDTARNENELIILVTPELVQPMEPEEVPPLPGFDVTEPTNKEFYWHGHLEGHPTSGYRSTVWPELRRRYRAGGPSMTSGPFGHGQ